MVPYVGLIIFAIHAAIKLGQKIRLVYEEEVRDRGFNMTQSLSRDSAAMDKAAAILKDLAPKAAAKGVTLGLENTLSAEDNLALLYATERAAPRVQPFAPQMELSAGFVGVCAVRKGLHFALEAWLQSRASHDGKFLIAGEFLPEYRARLSSMLSHPSIQILGHRNDIPDLMRRADLFVLPSIEEGFGLVCTEAMASGCLCSFRRVGEVDRQLEGCGLLSTPTERKVTAMKSRRR